MEDKKVVVVTGGSSGMGLVARIPLKRIGEPEDIAYMVAFLISEDAGDITGGAFPVGGVVSSSSMHSK